MYRDGGHSQGMTSSQSGGVRFNICMVLTHKGKRIMQGFQQNIACHLGEAKNNEKIALGR
jgi:hypothetical protein